MKIVSIFFCFLSILGLVSATSGNVGTNETLAEGTTSKRYMRGSVVEDNKVGADRHLHGVTAKGTYVAAKGAHVVPAKGTYNVAAKGTYVAAKGAHVVPAKGTYNVAAKGTYTVPAKGTYIAAKGTYAKVTNVAPHIHKYRYYKVYDEPSYSGPSKGKGSRRSGPSRSRGYYGYYVGPYGY